MKRIKKIIFVIISILLGLILAFNIYNFISLKVLHKDIATINGYAILEVVSGSMEPTILKGDIIIINTKDKDYKENDIITFRGKEGEFITHRILTIDNDTMVTKGDNNNAEDDSINKSVIVGKYVTKINGGGRILSSFKNPFTMVMIFVIGLLGCILLSTDSDGKPILAQDEKEFQEFLKSKNESKKEPENLETKEAKNKKTTKKEITKDSSKNEVKKNSKSKINTNSKDTKEENKISSTKKANSQKTTSSNKTSSSKNSANKKIEAKKTATVKKQIVEPKKVAKASTSKKDTSKKEVTKKPTAKKNSTNKTNSTTNKKKTATTKSSKK